MIPNWLRKSSIESRPSLRILGSKRKYGGNHSSYKENHKKTENTDPTSTSRGRHRSRTSTRRARIGAYYHTMEYIFVALRFVVCLPLTVDKKSCKVEFRVKSFAFAITVIAYAAWSVLVWIVVEERVEILVDSSHSFDDSVVAYVFIIYFVEWPLLPFIRWFWQTPRLITFMVKWRHFEDRFEKVTGSSLVLDKDMSRIIVAVIAISIPVISFLLTAVSQYIVDSMSPLHLVAYWIIVTQMYLNSALVWATSRALQAASLGLVQGLRKNVGNDAKRKNEHAFPDGETKLWLQQYMELWRKLSLMVRSSGSAAIGPAFILNIGKEFPNMLLTAYGVIAWLDGGAKGNESGVLLILIHHLTDLVLLGNSAHIATKSAGSDIRDELSLMMVKPRTSRNVKKEIQEFLQLMDATPPYITAGGYVTLDKEFVSKLMGTMVTYLVVLLQFRHAMHAPTMTWHHNSPSNPNITSNEIELGMLNATSKFKL